MDSSSSWHLSKAMIALSIIAVLLVLIQRFSTVQKDAREPPFIPSKIPILGHLVHLVREGADYYGRVDRRYKLSLYTLPVLKGRMYIVASPEWATAIHRAHKTLHFNTLVAQAMRNLFCMDEETMELINDNLNGENGNREGIMLTDNSRHDASHTCTVSFFLAYARPLRHHDAYDRTSETLMGYMLRLRQWSLFR